MYLDVFGVMVFVDGRSLVYGDISIDSTGLVNIDIHNVLILL